MLPCTNRLSALMESWANRYVASLLAGFAALGSMPQGWVFRLDGWRSGEAPGIDEGLWRPKKFRNGDANWSPEAAWGQEAAIHAKRAHPKPSAPVVFASNICKHTWFWLAESTSSNATKHHIIVTHNVFEMRKKRCHAKGLRKRRPAPALVQHPSAL